MNTIRTLKHRATLLALCLSLAAGTLGAQAVKNPPPSTNPPPTPPAPQPTSAPTRSSAGDDVVVLSKFEVTADRNVGYLAADTLAGTRVRTDLKDVASSISVATEELLRDIGATDNVTLLQYMPSTEVGGVYSNYAGLGNSSTVDETSKFGNPNSNTRVRGLSAADNTRDLFRTDIPWDGYNINRVDIQRGANSILFGLGSPAGIINAGLRTADFKNANDAQIRFGSYGSFRGSLNVNQQIMKNVLAVRVSALTSNTYFRQDPAYDDTNRIYAGLRFDPKLFKDNSYHTSIRANFERGTVDANRPRTVTPVDYITPWFRSASDPRGGLGKQTFDPYQLEDQENITGDNRGQRRAADPDFNAWIGPYGGTFDQPVGYYNNDTGNLERYYGGVYIKGGRAPNGTIDNGVNAIPYRRLASVSGYADYATQGKLPLWQFGQYKNQHLTDSSVFNFYDNLIDGPNKHEWGDWDAYNITLVQTALNDRVGVEFAYDRQKYNQGQSALLSGQVGIYMDLMSMFEDFSPNPNAGRPFTVGQGKYGNSSYDSDIETMRATAYGEIHGSDFVNKNSLLAKIIGRHRFTGLYNYERFQSENRSWNLYGSTDAFDKYVTIGASSPFGDLSPAALIYLGPSLASRNSASGANIPRIQSAINMGGGPLYHFASIWNAPSSVGFGDPWDRAADPVWGQQPESTGDTQSENPANYIGWNSNYYLDILNATNGDKDALTTSANKSIRKITSYAGVWQSFWWDGAIVGLLGWRYDRVENQFAQAKPNPANRQRLVLNPDIYSLSAPGAEQPAMGNHSVSGGVVVHFNDLLKQRLPINVSLSYNQSDNFQASAVRTNMYNDPIAPPTGETKDWSLLLSTKDSRFTLKATKFNSSVKNATSSAVTNEGYIGSIVATMINWANVFEYNLSGYTPDTANTGNSGRYTYSPGAGETQADADAREARAVASVREMQSQINPRFYSTWGIAPNIIQRNNAVKPGQFQTTEDQDSEGYEFEFIANPLSNWRITFNASKINSVRTNIGGPEMRQMVELLDHYLNDTSAGDLRIYWGNPEATTALKEWNNNFAANWLRAKLTEGTAAPEIREWRFNIVTTYDFKEGFLKGASVGASYRWEDKNIIGYPVVPDPDNSNKGTFDLSNPYYGPSEDSVDLWIGYRHKITKNIDWQIQLNVRNLFATDGVIPITVQPDGKTWAAVRIKPERTWFVTNTFWF